MISKYDFRRPERILGNKTEIETYIIQLIQGKNGNYIANFKLENLLSRTSQLSKGVNFTMHQTEINFFLTHRV